MWLTFGTKKVLLHIHPRGGGLRPLDCILPDPVWSIYILYYSSYESPVRFIIFDEDVDSRTLGNIVVIAWRSAVVFTVPQYHL